MNRLEPHIPAVLCFAGLDPTGGAGLQADIETIVSMGGHPLPIATSLTAQDTHDVRALMPIDPRHVIVQARTVLADIPVAAVKIGLLGSVGIVDALQEILTDCDGVPVVLDPIHRAGGGAPLASDELTSAVLSQLVPRTTVLTPNTREARRLAPGAATLANAARRLLSSAADTCSSPARTRRHPASSTASMDAGDSSSPSNGLASRACSTEVDARWPPRWPRGWPAAPPRGRR